MTALHEAIVAGARPATGTASKRTRLVRSLAPHRPYLRGVPPGLPFQWDAATIQRGLNFTLTTAVGDIDLLGEITGGGTYESLLPDCITLTIFGTQCPCLSLEQLLLLREARIQQTAVRVVLHDNQVAPRLPRQPRVAGPVEVQHHPPQGPMLFIGDSIAAKGGHL